MAESEARIGTRSGSAALPGVSETEMPPSAAVAAHIDHAQAGARLQRFHIPGWLVYVLAVAALTAIVFLLVPDGGRTALLVLFMGLMMVHHLPGLGHHGGMAAHPAAARERSADSDDSPQDSGSNPPCH